MTESGDLRRGEVEAGERVGKESLGRDGYVHYLDCG